MIDEHPRHAMVAGATETVGAALPGQWVPVNMYEAGEAVVVVAPLPAVMPDDVTVAITDRTMRIRASLRSAAPKDYLLHEWHYGRYERDVALPDGFGGPAEATLANGQLAVRVLRGAPNGPVAVHPTRPAA